MLRYIFCLFSSLAIATTTQAKPESLIIVAEHMPPYQIIDNNYVDGYSIEIIKHLLKKAEIDYTFIPMDWHRAYSFVQKKTNTVLLSVARNPDRESLLHWLFKINSALEVSVWTNKNNSHAVGSLSEITTEIIAEVRNSFNHTVLNNYPNITQKNIILTTDKEQVLSLLSKQRANYMLVNEDTLNWRLKSLSLVKEDYKKLFELNTGQNDLYIATNKNTSPRLIKKMAATYQKMLADGSIASIREKWFDEQK